MRLSEQQQIFTRNIALLISFAFKNDIGLTMGEAYRTKSQILLNFFGFKIEKGGVIGIRLVKSRRLSKTLKSLHADRLAIDFNFFIRGKLTYAYSDILLLGNYWESLDPANRWGGDFNKNNIEDGFVDTPHFQMNRI